MTEKHELHRLLVRSGAGIGEVNAVRKHVSGIKGGRLAHAMAGGRIVNLTVSDVSGGALDAITDPTVQDTTTVEDAIAALRIHGLWDQVAASVRRHLESGGAESPSLAGAAVRTVVLVDGETACRAMAERAAELGYRPIVISTSLEGESREVGATLIDLGRESARSGRPFTAPCMLIGCGGETTVTIRNGALLGAGGPNQEAALGGRCGWARASRSPLRSSTPTARTAARTPPARSWTGTRRPAPAPPGSTCAARCSGTRPARPCARSTT